MGLVINPIGVIRTPFNNLEGMPIQSSGSVGVQGVVVINPELESGLDDLDGFSHIILLYHFHQSTSFKLKVTPFLDDAPKGVFSTRAPRRPNPVGLSVVRLAGRERNRLTVIDIDVLDQTPLIDIKPYVPWFDVKEVTAAGWLEKNQKNVISATSDDRFVEKQ